MHVRAIYQQKVNYVINKNATDTFRLLHCCTRSTFKEDNADFDSCWQMMEMCGA